MNDVASHRPLRIGLTGGIASGKSTVAGFFADLGVPVIDTDAIAREVVATGAPALAEIRDTFGSGVFAGELLDRRKMRQVVFADTGKRRLLEGIVHPRIREATIAQAAAVQSPYLIIVVPLLVESPMKDFMDRILVVDCSEEIQLSRLLARDGETESQARRIIASQASREERRRIADDVVRNDADPDATRKMIDTLHQQYLALSQQGLPDNADDHCLSPSTGAE